MTQVMPTPSAYPIQRPPTTQAQLRVPHRTARCFGHGLTVTRPGEVAKDPLRDRTSSIRIGPKSAPTSSCDDVPFVSAIRSPVTDDAASRHTTHTTTGSQSVEVSAGVAGKPSPFCRRFPCLTPTKACWLVVGPCDGALRSTAPGKRRRLHSKIRIAYLVPPPSAAGPTAWPRHNRLDPSCARSRLRRSAGTRRAAADQALSRLTPVVQVLWPLCLDPPRSKILSCPPPQIRIRKVFGVDNCRPGNGFNQIGSASTVPQ